jgi:tetratricopeptide (TPR) repeat protein
MSKKDIKPKENQSNKKIIERSTKKTPIWFYGVMILIPVVFFVGLELLLRQLNYGYNFEQFIQTSNYHKDKFFLNPDIPRKYFFNLKASPSVLPDGFDIQKQENTFRVFILGESSAAGWPYVPNASFPRHIKRKLELLYPENNIEVINCGMSAINTYTLRDFVPGIIEQQPDLILIYTGHNEYYGALGAGSSVSLGYSRSLVNTYLKLVDFKTTQFLQNIISSIYGIFSSSSEKEGEAGNETLMSRMIGESLISYESDIYNYGIEQFSGNMDDMLKMFKDKNIPVLLGTLTCNLKDLKPFVSVKDDRFPPAEDVYNQAKDLYGKGEITKAKELFFEAKELDALRFRAPQKINASIYNLAKKYNYPVVDIDSAFKSKSPNGIVGENLMVDHLHPNLNGYRLMADEYFKAMSNLKLLPKGSHAKISETKADSILAANFPFTRLDSTVAEMQLMILTGQYPFTPKGTINYKVMNYKIKDFVDSIAVQVINKDIRWETAHATLSNYYFLKRDYAKCIDEMQAVIAERPYYDVPYKDLITKLVDGDQLDDAEVFLEKLYSLKPDYFACKWLGQVKLKMNKSDEALKYLLEAVKFKEADSQTWYNLAGAYYLNKQEEKALEALQRSINLNPQNRLAINFYNQLSQVLKNKK